MKQLGKRGKINQQANIKLKKLFEEKNLVCCEICGSSDFLSWAHRKKRIEYRKTPELLSDFNEVLLLCVPHHQEIEFDKVKTQELFTRLRGEGVENNGL